MRVKRKVLIIRTDTLRVGRDNSEMQNKWLKQRIRELGKTQMGLAAELGLARSGINAIINGTRRIASSEVPIIARYLEWPAAKVLGLISDPSGFTPNVDEDTRPLAGVRVIGQVEAGVFRDALELPYDEQFEIEVPVSATYRTLPRAGLIVRGPSMNRVYPEGTILIVVSVIHLGEDFDPRSGQRVIVQRRNREGCEATVKELVIDDDGQAWLWPRSNHPEFQQPWRVPDHHDGDGTVDDDNDGLRITGLVVGSYRPE